jgi:hypothetical protein
MADRNSRTARRRRCLSREELPFLFARLIVRVLEEFVEFVVDRFELVPQLGVLLLQASVATTQIYTRIAIQDLAAAHRRRHPRFGLDLP